MNLETALTALDDGRVTLSRAAEMADVSVWELRKRAVEESVTWVDESNTVEGLAEL